MNQDKGLKSFFTKKETQDMRKTDSDDYTVAHSRRVDMILRILSLVCAVVIWIFIVIGDSATKEFNCQGRYDFAKNIYDRLRRDTGEFRDSRSRHGDQPDLRNRYFGLC